MAEIKRHPSLQDPTPPSLTADPKESPMPNSKTEHENPTSEQSPGSGVRRFLIGLSIVLTAGLLGLLTGIFYSRWEDVSQSFGRAEIRAPLPAPIQSSQPAPESAPAQTALAPQPPLSETPADEELPVLETDLPPEPATSVVEDVPGVEANPAEESVISETSPEETRAEELPPAQAAVSYPSQELLDGILLRLQSLEDENLNLRALLSRIPRALALIEALRTRIETSQPFEQELNALSAFLPEDAALRTEVLPILLPFARQGVWTMTRLEEAFINQVQPRIMNGTWPQEKEEAEKSFEALAGLVRITKTSQDTKSATETPQPDLARQIRVHLRDHNLPAALVLFDQLAFGAVENPATTPEAQWKIQAKARVLLMRYFWEISQAVLGLVIPPVPRREGP